MVYAYHDQLFPIDSHCPFFRIATIRKLTVRGANWITFNPQSRRRWNTLISVSRICDWNRLYD